MKLRSEQKSGEWMIEQVYKFLEVGVLVLITCACSLVTAKYCLQLLEHCRFLGLERNLACFQDALLSLVEIYSKLVFGPESQIVGREKAVETSEVFVRNWKPSNQEKGLIAGLCQPDLFLCTHSRCQYYTFLEMCTKMQHYLKSAGTYFLSNYLMSNADISRTRMWRRSLRLTSHLKERRWESRQFLIPHLGWGCSMLEQLARWKV